MTTKLKGKAKQAARKKLRANVVSLNKYRKADPELVEVEARMDWHGNCSLHPLTEGAGPDTMMGPGMTFVRSDDGGTFIRGEVTSESLKIGIEMAKKENLVNPRSSLFATRHREVKIVNMCPISFGQFILRMMFEHDQVASEDGSGCSGCAAAEEYAQERFKLSDSKDGSWYWSVADESLTI
jgi:hypothetical protein